MGFLGSLVSGIGSFFGNFAKGISKFSSSPVGNSLMSIGLSYFTGGAGGAFGQQQGPGAMVGGNAGSLFGGGGGGGGGGLFSGSSGGGGGGGGFSWGGLFAGIASTFLGSSSSMLSGAGVGTFGSFMGQAVDSGQGSTGILQVAKALYDAQQSQKKQDDEATRRASQENIQQSIAFYQAQAAVRAQLQMQQQA